MLCDKTSVERSGAAQSLSRIIATFDVDRYMSKT